MCVGDDSERIIENTLQLVGRIQETVTVVDPAGDERLGESSGRVVVERALDEAQLSKLKEAFGADRSDVLVKRQIRRQWDSKDTDGEDIRAYSLCHGCPTCPTLL